VAKRKPKTAVDWLKADPNGFALALEAYERDIISRYGHSRTRGELLYEGDHWTNDEKTWADEVYFDGISDNLPVRNRYRRKVDHIAAMLSPGAPSVQFMVNVPSDNTQEDFEARREISTIYDSEWLEMIRRSEYQTEISRVIKDAENQHVGWVGILPLGAEQRLELIHVPNKRVIYDIGVTRLRHLKWIAWVDIISEEQAKAIFGEEKLDGVKPLKTQLDIIKTRLKKWNTAPQGMLTLIHFYALKGGIINTQKDRSGALRFDKAVHLVQVGDRLVHESTKVPQDRLPIAHCILESDMNDILGKGLSETADYLQAHLNRVVLHQAIQFMKNDIEKRVVYGLDTEQRMALRDPKQGDIATDDPNFKIEHASKPIIDNYTLEALNEAKQSFDENTGMFAVGEGERAPNIPSASGQMFLANVARTPINAKARYLAETIRTCGEIFMGWQRVWKPQGDISKYIDVRVDVDSLLELTRTDKYEILMQLAEVEAVDTETLIQHSPLPEVLRNELVAKYRALQQQQQQLLAQEIQGAAPGGELPPGMTPELPAGVSVE